MRNKFNSLDLINHSVHKLSTFSCDFISSMSWRNYAAKTTVTKFCSNEYVRNPRQKTVVILCAFSDILTVSKFLLPIKYGRNWWILFPWKSFNEVTVVRREKTEHINFLFSSRDDKGEFEKLSKEFLDHWNWQDSSCHHFLP